MAAGSKTICSTCGRSKRDRCPHCKGRRTNRRRTAARGYGYPWQKHAKDYITRHPWCECCLDYKAAASKCRAVGIDYSPAPKPRTLTRVDGRDGKRVGVVDHIKSARSGGGVSDANSLAMCRKCHGHKTAWERRQKASE